MQGTLLVVKKFKLWEHVVKYYNQFTFQHQWKALGPEIKDQANMWLYNISTLHLSLFLHVLWLLWCVYTQCTSPTISWKIPKMASLEGSFFSSEDTNCKTHIQRYHTYTYMTINSENVYTWLYRLFLGIQFPFMVSCWRSWNIVNTQIVVQHEPTEPDWCTEMLTIKHVLHRGWLCIGRCVVCWLFTYKCSRSYRPNPLFNSHRNTSY